MRLWVVLLCFASFVQAETLKQAIDRYVAAADEAPPSKPSEPWKITGAFGAALTDGNSETTTVTSGLEFDKEWDRWALDIDFSSIFSEDDGEQSANEARLTELLKYKIDAKQSIFQLFGLTHDDEAGLKYRVLFTLGYERVLIQKPDDRFELKGNVGAGVLHEEYRENDSTEGTAQAGLAISWKITDQLTYTGSVLFFPSLSEGGEFRAVFLNRFETPISDKMSFRLEINDNYNSRAPAGTEKNDLAVLFSLAIDFTRKTKPPE